MNFGWADKVEEELARQELGCSTFEPSPSFATTTLGEVVYSITENDIVEEPTIREVQHTEEQVSVSDITSDNSSLLTDVSSFSTPIKRDFTIFRILLVTLMNTSQSG